MERIGQFVPRAFAVVEGLHSGVVLEPPGFGQTNSKARTEEAQGDRDAGSASADDAHIAIEAFGRGGIAEIREHLSAESDQSADRGFRAREQPPIEEHRALVREVGADSLIESAGVQHRAQ